VSGIKKFFGPSTLVAAAFIGPGTVTMCTLAGNKYGYELLWALLFSTLATLILQEMAARIGLVTQDGLGTIVKAEKSKGILGLVNWKCSL
jgi:NRAMP (natural resistance-associated macrophage protein)-like metal ion transporter